MTDETRPGPGGDEAGPRKDGVLPVSPARRTRIVLRLRRPARRPPPDRQGPAERGRAEQGDGARAPRGRANPRGIAARRRRAERDRIPGGRRDLHAVRRLDPFPPDPRRILGRGDRKSTRLNSSHSQISYAVFCLKKKNTPNMKL